MLSFFFFYQTLSIAYDSVKKRSSIKPNLNLFNVVIFRCISRTLLAVRPGRITISFTGKPQDRKYFTVNGDMRSTIIQNFQFCFMAASAFLSLSRSLSLFFSQSLSITLCHRLLPFEDVLNAHHTTRTQSSREKSFLFAYIENIATTLKQPSVSLISIR